MGVGEGLCYHLPATCSAALRTLPRWLDRVAGRGRVQGGAHPTTRGFHSISITKQHGWRGGRAAPQCSAGGAKYLGRPVLSCPGAKLLTLPVNVDRSSPPMTLISPVDWSFCQQMRWVRWCFFFFPDAMSDHRAIMSP